MFSKAFPTLVNLWKNNKFSLFYYLALFAVFCSSFALPEVNCFYPADKLAHTLCDLGLPNSYQRAEFAAPILIALIVLKSIKTLRLFFELLFTFLGFTSFGYVLAYREIIKQNDVHFLNSIYGLLVPFLWLVSILSLIFLQDKLSTPRKRIPLFIIIVICETLIGIFVGIVTDLKLHPNAVITTAPPSCFVEGTLVWTPQGNVPIESLRVGDIIIAHNIDSNVFVNVPVLTTIRKQRTEMMFINNNLKVTPEHPMAVLSGDKVSWEEAGNLAVGKCLVSDSGECIKVNSIEYLKIPLTNVINLSVSAPHNFYVLAGEQKILVHNKQAISSEMRAQADAFWAQVADVNTKYSWAQVVPDGGFIRIFIEGRPDIRIPTDTSEEAIHAILDSIITSTSTSVLEVNGKIPWNEVLRLINTCQVQSFSDYSTIWNLYLKNGNPNYSANATYPIVEAANKAASSKCGGMFPMSHY